MKKTTIHSQFLVRPFQVSHAIGRQALLWIDELKNAFSQQGQIPVCGDDVANFKRATNGGSDRQSATVSKRRHQTLTRVTIPMRDVKLADSQL